MAAMGLGALPLAILARVTLGAIYPSPELVPILLRWIVTRDISSAGAWFFNLMLVLYILCGVYLRIRRRDLAFPALVTLPIDYAYVLILIGFDLFLVAIITSSTATGPGSSLGFDAALIGTGLLLVGFTAIWLVLRGLYLDVKRRPPDSPEEPSADSGS